MTEDSDRKQPKNPLGPTGARVMEAVKQLRQSKGLNYKQLSDRLESIERPIPVLGLSRLEKGERRVDVDDLVALAVALDTTPNRLLLPDLAVEHLADVHQLTPEAGATPPLLWAWASGEVPLGRMPATAADDRTARNAEASFAEANRPYRWKGWDEVWSTDQAEAVARLVVYVSRAFARGLSTEMIRAVVERALILALASHDPSAPSADVDDADVRGLGPRGE